MIKVFIDILNLLTQAWLITAWGRLLLQKGGLSFTEPLAQFCVQVTNFIVKPLRKIFPPLLGWDCAIIIAMIIIQILVQISILIIISLQGGVLHFAIVGFVVLNTLLLIIKAGAYALIIGLLMQMVLSLSRDRTSLLFVLQRIFYPLTQPFAFLRIGRMDFSASVVFIFLWVLITVIIPFLQMYLNTRIPVVFI